MWIVAEQENKNQGTADEGAARRARRQPEPNVAGGRNESGLDTRPEENRVSTEPSRRIEVPEGHLVDPTAMSGTVDTTGIGTGPHENYATVSTVAEVADERTRRVLEDSEDEANHGRTADEVFAEANAQRQASRREAFEERYNAGLITERERAMMQEQSGEGSREGGYDPGVADAHNAGTVQHGEQGTTEPVPTSEGQPTVEAHESDEAHDRNGEMQRGDDPGDYNVGPVETYLDSLGDSQEDQEERERVLQAEREGQARRSLVGD